MSKRGWITFFVVIIVAASVWLWERKRPLPPRAPTQPRVTLTLSPRGNFLRLTVSDWNDLRQLDDQWEKFFKAHPEISCDGGISFQDPNDPHSTTILCTVTQPPPENAQDQPSPP